MARKNIKTFQAERERNIERIKLLKVYMDCEEFTVQEVFHSLHGECRYDRVSGYLKEMKERGLLSKRTIADGSNRRAAYKRTSKLARAPWRKHTNEELGIRPARLGMVGR